MKALLQRVTSASVSVGGEEVGRIGPGLVVFVGVSNGDAQQDIQYLVDKTINLRIFEDQAGKLNLSILDVKGELLLVSQFTLMAETRHGRRPSFTEAAPPAEADALFKQFVELIKASGLKTDTGRFQQHMHVEIHNNGPVTILLDSRDKF